MCDEKFASALRQITTDSLTHTHTDAGRCPRCPQRTPAWKLIVPLCGNVGSSPSFTGGLGRKSDSDLFPRWPQTPVSSRPVLACPVLSRPGALLSLVCRISPGCQLPAVVPVRVGSCVSWETLSLLLLALMSPRLFRSLRRHKSAPGLLTATLRSHKTRPHRPAAASAFTFGSPPLAALNAIVA